MYNSITTGRKSGIGPSGVAIMGTDHLALNGIQIFGASTNTVNVYVGASGDLSADGNDYTDGFAITPKGGVFIPIKHPNILYVRTDTATDQKLWWILV